MPRDFFDPTAEEQIVVLVDEATVRKAEKLIGSCEHCNPDGVEIPFDNILDRVTGSDHSVTDYILENPAKCPNCRRDVLEKTLVEPTWQYIQPPVLIQQWLNSFRILRRNPPERKLRAALRGNAETGDRPRSGVPSNQTRKSHSTPQRC